MLPKKAKLYARFYALNFSDHYQALPHPNSMHDSSPPTTDQGIPPVPKTATRKFAMPPPPRTLQEQNVGAIFSIETDDQTQPAQPNIIIKTTETTRKQSDSKLLSLILLTLSLIACVLGIIVFCLE